MLCSFNDIDIEVISNSDWYKQPIADDALYIRKRLLGFLQDDDTARHANRVSNILKIIAQQLGFLPHHAEIMRLAATLHDIGKVAVPVEIINKPGKLTPEEYDIVKKHSYGGYEMLRDREIEFFDLAALMSLQHHERWDGTGYPYGLKGDEIACEAQLVGICDVYEALTAQRIYKQPWPENKIIEHLISTKNKHFNPLVVDVFLDSLDLIRHIE